MPTADGDPITRDSPDAAPDASAPGERSPATQEDVVPALHILVAAHEQERKETADLIAGFDRRGRVPKKTARGRDFVDYYAKRGSASESPPDENAAAPRPPQAPTVVVASRRRTPAWVAWAGAAAAMIAVGAAVALLATPATRDIPPASPPSAGGPGAPRALTTAPEPTPPLVATAADTATDRVPPSKAATPPAPSARAPKAREPATGAAAKPSGPPPSAKPPSEDFYRGL